MAVQGNRRKLARTAVWIGIVVLLAIFWFTGLLATVKPMSEAKSLAAVMGGGVAFDKAKYVDGIWDSRVVPTVEQKSIELGVLIPALEKNADQAGKTYGNNVGGADNFLIRFAGTVTAVDTQSQTGSITVSVPYKGGTLPVSVLIGPIILGTALRDAVGFITFEQFTNQIQFGGVSDSLNDRVMKDVVSKLDLKTILGKKVSVDGAFTYDGADAHDLQVTPVVVRME
ncbi:MAG TPA: DUF2291 domain-containing protein [Rectinemataceae bacterium]|nr:DUF2291 domain-containing protein [Rectinemataceae bacterium]